MATHDGVPSNVDETHSLDLVPLDQFGSRSETRIVVTLLKSNGIPAVLGGLYNPKAPQQILVPRGSLEAANRVIADARSLNCGSDSPEPPPEEPRSIVTAITWVLGIGLIAYAVFEIGEAIYHLAKHWFQ